MPEGMAKRFLASRPDVPLPFKMLRPLTLHTPLESRGNKPPSPEAAFSPPSSGQTNPNWPKPQSGTWLHPSILGNNGKLWDKVENFLRLYGKRYATGKESGARAKIAPSPAARAIKQTQAFPVISAIARGSVPRFPGFPTMPIPSHGRHKFAAFSPGGRGDIPSRAPLFPFRPTSRIAGGERVGRQFCAGSRSIGLLSLGSGCRSGTGVTPRSPRGSLGLPSVALATLAVELAGKASVG